MPALIRIVQQADERGLTVTLQILALDVVRMRNQILRTGSADSQANFSVHDRQA